MTRNARLKADDTLAEKLASGSSIVDAATACGISPTTVRRRLTDSGFQGLVSQIRGQMLGRAVGRLLNLLDDAVDAMASVVKPMIWEEEGMLLPGYLTARLASAKAIFEHATRGHELLDLTERVRLIEERARQQETA